jgi:hypothetical protein
LVSKNGKLTVYKNEKIPYSDTHANDSITWNNNTEEKVKKKHWRPSFSFVPENIKAHFKDHEIHSHPWIVVDEFFLNLLNILIFFV